MRFLLSDATWRDAKVRILIINSDTSLHDNLYRNTNAILIEKRIKAEVKVINDDFGSRRKEEILDSESHDTDLIILGLSEKNTSYRPEYIEKINRICDLPGSVLLLSPSPEFEEINLLERHASKVSLKSSTLPLDLKALPEIEIELLKTKLEALDEKLMLIANTFSEKGIKKTTSQILALSSNLRKASKHITNNLTKEIETTDSYEYRKVIIRNHISYLNSVLNLIDTKNTIIIKESKEILQGGILHFQKQVNDLLNETEDTITIPYRSDSKKKDQMLQYPYRKALQYYIESKAKVSLNEQLIHFEKESKIYLNSLQNQVLIMNDELEKLLQDKKGGAKAELSSLSRISENIKIIEDQVEITTSGFTLAMMGTMRDISIEIAESLKTPADLKNSKKLIKSRSPQLNESINSFAENWGSGMQLLNNTLSLDIMMLLKKNQYENIISKANKRCSVPIEDSLFRKQDLLIENIRSIIQDAQSNIEPVLFPDELRLQAPLSEAFEKATALMGEMPEDYILPELIYKDSDWIEFSEYTPVSISVLKSANYYLDVLFHEPIYRDYENLERTVKRAIIESKEANSMLLFHQSNIKNAQNDDEKFDSNVALFKKLLKQIEGEKEKVKTSLARINHYADNYISEAFSKLFYHSIMEESKTILSGEREQKGRRFTLSFLRLSEKFKMQFNNGLVYFINSLSSGMVFSKKYLKEKKIKEVQSKDILDLGDELLPNSKVFASIPVFYRHLMSSRSKISDEFWIARPEEISIIKAAHKRHKKGFGGAVFITGVNGAGKTTLSRHAVNHMFKRQNSIWISPPMDGTTNPEILLEELKKQTGINDDYAGIFNSLPFESVILIDDLELWWERRPGGGDALEQLFELVKLYSSKVFFIINCNIHAYKPIQEIYNLNQYSQATINCSTLNAKELQQMILQRHKSSGLSLMYNGNDEETISQLSYSILFNRYLNVSEGIPGVAVNTWIANIKNVDDDTIEIKKPERISPGILYDLPKDWLLFLTIFLQHKNLSEQKLSRIAALDLSSASNMIQSLQNAGLIEKTTNNVYAIVRNIEPLITEVCDEKGLI